VWAFIGIIYKRTMPDSEFYLSIVVFAAAGISLILATIVFQAVQRFVKKG
jgi:hypothetical protein